MLNNAGIDHIVDPADIDETPLQADARLAPRDIAVRLACEKAAHVSLRHRDAYVIGADQVLAFGDRLLTKPGNPDGVRTQLKTLRGKSHTLISAVAVARNGEVLWTHSDAATLQMRDFSDEFLGDYVAQVGDVVAGSVGGYHLEGLGAQLFARVNGDHFTVLGLPLIALLNFLRSEDVIPA